jgi:hypothetical protein
MAALPAALGTDAQEGILPLDTVLVSSFLAKAFGLDEASLAAGSDPTTADNSSGDASGSLGSGGRGLRYTTSPGFASLAPDGHALPLGVGAAGAHTALRGVLPGGAGESRPALRAAGGASHSAPRVLLGRVDIGRGLARRWRRIAGAAARRHATRAWHARLACARSLRVVLVAKILATLLLAANSPFAFPCRPVRAQEAASVRPSTRRRPAAERTRTVRRSRRGARPNRAPLARLVTASHARMSRAAPPLTRATTLAHQAHQRCSTSRPRRT